MDTVARLDDPGQALDIEVDEVARSLVFVAHHRRRRIERTQTVHAGTAQDAAHGGPAQSQCLGDAPTVVAKMAKGHHLLL